MYIWVRLLGTLDSLDSFHNEWRSFPSGVFRLGVLFLELRRSHMDDQGSDAKEGFKTATPGSCMQAVDHTESFVSE